MSSVFTANITLTEMNPEQAIGCTLAKSDTPFFIVPKRNFENPETNLDYVLDGLYTAYRQYSQLERPSDDFCSYILCGVHTCVEDAPWVFFSESQARELYEEFTLRNLAQEKADKALEQVRKHNKKIVSNVQAILNSLQIKA